jgi:dienelactone hydrolase
MRSFRCSRLFVGLIVCFSAQAIHAADETKPETAGSWPIQKLMQTPAVVWLDETKPIRSLLYVGEPAAGKPTQVFAYYASPATLRGKPAAGDERFPGVVLIHGGGGTAFKAWVELWAKRGYAAIAMDLGGSRPDDADPKKRTRLEDGGPAQDDKAKFDSIATEDLTDDWPYHAVASSILAHSLLRSFSDVDAERTAVTGISWGGYTCSLVASVDSRFKAAVPVYGCGFLQENSVWLPQFARLGAAQTRRWVQMYDPSSHLPRCRVPLLWVNGTNDFAYPLDSYAKSIQAATEAKTTVRIEVKMPHGHEAGWAPREIGAFIDHQLGVPAAKPLPRSEAAVASGGSVTAKFQSETAIKSAILHYTLPPGPINKREWKSQPATVRGNTIVAESLPLEADIFFVSLTDERGLMTTSPPVVRFSRDH